MNVHFSSKTDAWSTPQEFFDKLNEEFHFTIDVCATPANAKCKRFYTQEDDGLEQDWSDEVAWMNPPLRQKHHFLDRESEPVESDGGLFGPRPNRYLLVPRFYLSQGRNQIYQRKTEVRWLKELRPISFNGSNF